MSNLSKFLACEVGLQKCHVVPSRCDRAGLRCAMSLESNATAIEPPVSLEGSDSYWAVGVSQLPPFGPYCFFHVSLWCGGMVVVVFVSSNTGGSSSSGGGGGGGGSGKVVVVVAVR